MKLPTKLFAIAVLALAFMFAYSPPPAADDRSAHQTEADNGTVASTSVDANTVAIECQDFGQMVRESVGKPVLNVRSTTFEPVKELAGYRTVIDKPKISIRYEGQLDHFAGFANTRAREQVQS